MPTITFNAFSSLRKKRNPEKIDDVNAVMDIKSGLTARVFLCQMGFTESQVGAVFINGRVIPLNTVIKDGDRVAFVPRFSPGSGKTLQGLKNIKKIIHTHKKS